MNDMLSTEIYVTYFAFSHDIIDMNLDLVNMLNAPLYTMAAPMTELGWFGKK